MKVHLNSQNGLSIEASLTPTCDEDGHESVRLDADESVSDFIAEWARKHYWDHDYYMWDTELEVSITVMVLSAKRRSERPKVRRPTKLPGVKRVSQ